jgi:hypothetical protein
MPPNGFFPSGLPVKIMCPFHASPIGSLSTHRLLNRHICGLIPVVGIGAEVLIIIRSSRRNICFALKLRVHLNSFHQRVVFYISNFTHLERKTKEYYLLGYNAV